MRRLLALVLIAAVLLTAAVAWAGAAPGILIAVGALLPPESIETAADEPGRAACSIDTATQVVCVVEDDGGGDPPVPADS